MGAGEAILESDTLGQDVRLTLRKSVDRFTECIDRRDPLGFSNRVVLIVMGNEISQDGSVITDRCLK